MNPISLSFSASTSNLPSNKNAGLVIREYTPFQSISLNSFHSVAITTASALRHASMAFLEIVTCFLTQTENDQRMQGIGVRTPTLVEGNIRGSFGEI